MLVEAAKHEAEAQRLGRCKPNHKARRRLYLGSPFTLIAAPFLVLAAQLQHHHEQEAESKQYTQDAGHEIRPNWLRSTPEIASRARNDVRYADCTCSGPVPKAESKLAVLATLQADVAEKERECGLDLNPAVGTTHALSCMSTSPRHHADESGVKIPLTWTCAKGCRQLICPRRTFSFP